MSSAQLDDEHTSSQDWGQDVLSEAGVAQTTGPDFQMLSVEVRLQLSAIEFLSSWISNLTFNVVRLMQCWGVVKFYG